MSGHHPPHMISDAGGAPAGEPALSRVQIGTSGEYELMKSRETLIRLKKFQVDEKRRRVAQIEGMIADFQRMSVDLEREIQTEQERAGINDPSHFAYPTYAKAAIQRRENLTRSADELRIQLEDAKSAAGRSLRGTEEGRAARRARPGARARRGERPRAGRHGQHRPDARPHRRRRLTLSHRSMPRHRRTRAARSGFFVVMSTGARRDLVDWFGARYATTDVATAARAEGDGGHRDLGDAEC